MVCCRASVPQFKVRGPSVSRAAVKTVETAETSTASAEALGKIVLLWKPGLFTPKPRRLPGILPLPVLGYFHDVSLLGRSAAIDSTTFNVWFLSDRMNKSKSLEILWSKPKLFLKSKHVVSTDFTIALIFGMCMSKIPEQSWMSCFQG